jgi:thioredoxin-related protein
MANVYGIHRIIVSDNYDNSYYSNGEIENWIYKCHNNVDVNKNKNQSDFVIFLKIFINIILYILVFFVIFVFIWSLLSVGKSKNSDGHENNDNNVYNIKNKYVVGIVYKDNCPSCNVFKPMWRKMRKDYKKCTSLYEYNFDKWSKCKNKYLKNKIDNLIDIKLRSNEAMSIPYVFLYDTVNNVDIAVSQKELLNNPSAVHQSILEQLYIKN